MSARKLPAIVSTDAEIVSVKLLKPHPENPRRRADLTMLVESLREHGQYRPLVVQKSSGHVIGGNHTLKAAIEIGMKEVAVTYLDVTDAEARRILLMDNRASDLGTYATDDLLQLLDSTIADYDDLLGTGYDFAVLDDLRHNRHDKDVIKNIADVADSYRPKTERAEGRSLNDNEWVEQGVRVVLLSFSSEQHEFWTANEAKLFTLFGVKSAAALVVAMAEHALASEG